MEVSKISIAIVISLMAVAMAPLSLSQNSPQDILAAHNAARAEVGVGPVTWNSTVASYAEKYAGQRSFDCVLVHSMGPYGENIAAGWGYEFTALDAVKLWVAEKPYYNYESNSCVGQECLHYTQVVWRNTAEIGCARVQCRTGGWFVTCNYYPPGNFIGQRPY